MEVLTLQQRMGDPHSICFSIILWRYQQCPVTKALDRHLVESSNTPCAWSHAFICMLSRPYLLCVSLSCLSLPQIQTVCGRRLTKRWRYGKRAVFVGKEKNASKYRLQWRGDPQGRGRLIWSPLNMLCQVDHEFLSCVIYSLLSESVPSCPGQPAVKRLSYLLSILTCKWWILKEIVSWAQTAQL